MHLIEWETDSIRAGMVPRDVSATVVREFTLELDGPEAGDGDPDDWILYDMEHMRELSGKLRGWGLTGRLDRRVHVWKDRMTVSWWLEDLVLVRRVV